MGLVGLTGGIGCGKSTVARLLATRGARVIDADQIAREVLEPGARCYQAVVGRFGPEVLLPDGRVDRPALAAAVFADPGALADLNAITHPAIGEEIVERARAASASPGPVVVDLPLLDRSAKRRYGLAAVIVVDAPEELAMARLVGQRGFSADDARARMAAQMSRAERLALADRVLDNSGDLQSLEEQVDALWPWLVSLGGQ